MRLGKGGTKAGKEHFQVYATALNVVGLAHSKLSRRWVEPNWKVLFSIFLYGQKDVEGWDMYRKLGSAIVGYTGDVLIDRPEFKIGKEFILDTGSVRLFRKGVGIPNSTTFPLFGKLGFYDGQQSGSVCRKNGAAFNNYTDMTCEVRYPNH